MLKIFILIQLSRLTFLNVFEILITHANGAMNENDSEMKWSIQLSP